MWVRACLYVYRSEQAIELVNSTSAFCIQYVCTIYVHRSPFMYLWYYAMRVSGSAIMYGCTYMCIHESMHLCSSSVSFLDVCSFDVMQICFQYTMTI